MFVRTGTLGYCVVTCGGLWGVEPTCHELLHVLCVPKRVGLDLLMECSTVHGREIVVNLGRSFSCPATGLVYPKEPTGQRLVREEEASGQRDLGEEPVGLRVKERITLIVFRSYAGVEC